MALKPIEFKKDAYSKSYRDIATSFARNPITKDVGSVINENSIKQALKNMILTRRGERLFNPNSGSEVYASLFEPLDPFMMDLIRSEILNTIQNYEMRIQVISLEVIPIYENNSLQVILTYRIVGEPISYEVDFILTRDF